MGNAALASQDAADGRGATVAAGASTFPAHVPWRRSRATELPAADSDKLVPIADPGGDDVDQDLVSGRRRLLVHVENLDGLAKRPDPGDSHRSGASQRRP